MNEDLINDVNNVISSEGKIKRIFVSIFVALPKTFSNNSINILINRKINALYNYFTLKASTHTSVYLFYFSDKRDCPWSPKVPH
jgi:hypothetical protein